MPTPNVIFGPISKLSRLFRQQKSCLAGVLTHGPKRKLTLWTSASQLVSFSRMQRKHIFRMMSTDPTKIQPSLDAAAAAAAQSSSSTIVEKLELRVDHEKIEAERAERHRKTSRNMKFTAIGMGVFFAVGGISIIYFCGTPNVDDFGKVVADEYSELPFVEQLFKRSWANVWLFVKSVPEPSRDKLLPEPLKEPYYQPRYTIVFEISGVLVHPDWTFNTGWRFKKRPAIDYFLKTLGYPRSELVVYTSEHGMTAHPIIDSLDTDGAIMYRLYRDTTKYQYKDGSHVKDLGKLNRDLKRVIYVDWDNTSFQLNPENALRIRKWDGDIQDVDLVDLANLLRTIIDSNPEDVRPILQYYSSFDDPLAVFREKQKKVLELEQAKSSETRQIGHSFTKSWSGGLFGRGRL